MENFMPQISEFWKEPRREVHTAEPLDLFHQTVCYLLAPALAD